MPRKKNANIKLVENFVKVRVIGPRCQFGDRLIMPGETATVPAELAQEWILTMRAVEIATAEVKHDNGQND